jgi:hypothetical protein
VSDAEDKELDDMKSTKRLAAMAVIAAAAILAGSPSHSASSGFYQESGPRWEDQVVDAVVARPLGIVATGAGAVVWGVSLPFSLLGGNAGESADKLVGGPARETFVRCLGCRSAGRRQFAADTQ